MSRVNILEGTFVIKENQSTMEKNRVLAVFDGTLIERDEVKFSGGTQKVEKILGYHNSYDLLMPVWAKFRELRFEDSGHKISPTVTFNMHKHEIIKKITYGTLADFYTALVNAVEWWNQISNEKNK